MTVRRYQRKQFNVIPKSLLQFLLFQSVWSDIMLADDRKATAVSESTTGSIWSVLLCCDHPIHPILAGVRQQH